MDVNVGQFSDPVDVPGLAHFCEHMLFLGTEKYPNENEYVRGCVRAWVVGCLLACFMDGRNCLPNPPPTNHSTNTRAVSTSSDARRTHAKYFNTNQQG